MINIKPFTPYLTYDPEDLNNICAKVHIWDNDADIKHFYQFMRSGLFNHRVLPFIAYNENNNMIGCVVVSVSQSPMNPDDVLYIQWLWIDPHYPSFWKKGMELLVELCQKLKIKKMVGNTRRLPKAMEKKFGFIQTDAIIEKEVS